MISVITSTIGRPELRQCIESVAKQTTKCRHYVFVNGPEFHEKAHAILREYPEVHAFYLPESTGDYGVGPSMADVFAGAPFLTRSEWICFLDDDNWFDSDHIECLHSFSTTHNLDWTFSLRKFISAKGEFLCNDDWDSVGLWGDFLGKEEPDQLVDNSCYFLKRSIAMRIAFAWTLQPLIADRCFFLSLKRARLRAGCVGRYSVNYRVGASNKSPESLYLDYARIWKENFPTGYPWAKEELFLP